MSDVSVALGTANGDGKFRVLYRYGQEEHLDSFDATDAYRRGQSLSRMSLRFGLKPQDVKDLDGQLQELVKQHLKSKTGGKNRSWTGGPASHFQPMPLDAFPPRLRKYITTVAAAIGCDPSFIAMWLLPALSGCIGNSCRVVIKSSWSEPSTIWTLLIADSGQYKSPTMKHVLQPLHEWQSRAFAEYAAEMATYQEDLADYENAYKGHRRKDSPKPPPPQAPVCARHLANDATIEALLSLLESHPRGLPLFMEEATSWFRSFGQYKGGRGGDVGHWLLMADASPIMNDRKTGQKKAIFIRRANVAIGLATQPATLRLDAAGNIDNGLLPRFLVAMPPKQKVGWNDNEVSERTAETLCFVYGRLLQLQPAGELLDPFPVDMPLAPDAKNRFSQFVDRHGEEQYELSGALAAVWSKYKAYAARLALVLSLTEWACGDTFVAPTMIDVACMDSAIKLVEWFKGEARRVYAMLDASEDDQGRQVLAERLQQHGKPITARELAKLSRRYGDSEAAEDALEDLADHGFGKWQTQGPGDQGGRPTRRFAVNGLVGETPANPEEN